MRKRNNFRKRKPRENRLNGLQVKVYNNNIEGALKQFKKKVKESNLMLELKKKSYYEKPSKLRREKKNLAILRSRYNNIKEEKSY
jgi:ribosomal protein S21